uniref:Uncharacterized protein n=1 Tax=Bionectria ochroleuca TaxID=29856 RepID=A0A8H7N7G6_BIOOC
MAARPGEENVATLFGDIHYFYSGPEVKPRHHRFDKGSYVYLFENANERRCRIEIANHAGTPDQDAFDGFLDQTHVRYSYKQHCMVALTVAESVNQNEWHLPTFDPEMRTNTTTSSRRSISTSGHKRMLCNSSMVSGEFSLLRRLRYWMNQHHLRSQSR